MEQIQTLKQSGWRDMPSKWAEDSVIRQPDFDVKGFQEKIDAICGKTPAGHSIVRLVWAWDEKCYSPFYTDWDAAGIPIKQEFRAKYVYRKVSIDSETEVDICPPRWVLEERFEPAQYYGAWMQNRYQFNQRLKINVPVRPLPPRDGYYYFLTYIGAHDPKQRCCRRAAKKSRECFGLYRHPNQSDLNLLEKQRKMIDGLETRPNPYKELSPRDLENIQAECETAERERKEQKLGEAEESRKEFEEIIRPSAAYSLPGEKRTAGGLIIPS